MVEGAPAAVAHPLKSHRRDNAPIAAIAQLAIAQLAIAFAVSALTHLARDGGRQEPPRDSGREGGEQAHPCQICGKNFSKEAVLTAHLKSVHKIDRAEWQTLQDPTTGAYYYYNQRTSESSWTWPPSAPAPSAGSSSVARAWMCETDAP